MAEDNFGFASDKVVKRAAKDIPDTLMSSNSQTSQSPRWSSSDATKTQPSCVGRFMNSKFPISKGYIMVSICFLATILVSGSIFVVSSYGNSLGLDDKLPLFHKTHLQLETNFGDAMKLSEDGADNFLLEGSTNSGSGTDSENPELLISENGNSAIGDRKGGIESCTVEHALMRIYMYDLPPEFHFGMISALPAGRLWPTNASEIPRYPGGLYQQHSPEYWLTADLLTSIYADRRNPCTVVRVKEHRLANAYFVPYFSSLSYNKYSRGGYKARADQNEVLQQRLVKFLLKQEAWKASEGRNHIIPMHHPNSLNVGRQHLRNAMFVVADFGRYSKEVANVAKDVVAPYKHIVPYFHNDNTSFDSRKILLFFQGAIIRKEGGVIRQKLHELLKHEQEVHFTTGNTQSNGVRSATQGMRSAKFCLHLAGDTPSSNRLFDAIASHCVPVIVSDEIELPYEDQLDYSEFCLFVRSSNALKKGFVIKLLKSITSVEWTVMWHNLHQVGHHFEFWHPTQPDDAVHMTWKAVARKISSVNLSIHKSKRYWRSNSGQ
ncbi:hypothetical protein O6H91_15G062200 [Diphasiastrum complanatum]|uniref:Uncharacterized protein n=1 Tax=Diphasiastrum complanatum TaxID=34168 RepID=A0ACC2BJQ1_DIPCM|nr:hypothetical protein O6H91_15G062200 [Diphasiastrum complanatum]